MYARFYLKNKKGLKKSHEKYQNLSVEDKSRKWQYGCKFRNLSEKSKNYLSIQKNITKCKKINICCNKGWLIFYNKELGIFPGSTRIHLFF